MACAEIAVEVVYAADPHHIQQCQLRLAAGATVLDALRQCGLPVTRDAALLDSLHLGVWGRACTPEAVLRDRDRVELCRPLQIDPKEARRLRYRKDGLRKRAVQPARPRRPR